MKHVLPWMTNRSVPRLLRAARFSLRHLGLLGWVGIALMAGGAWYGVALMPQRNSQISSLQAQIAQLQLERAALASKEVSQENHTANAVKVVMPTIKDVPQMILTLEGLAKREGLNVQRNEYRYVDLSSATLQKEKVTMVGEQLLEVRITTPVSGTYSSLRAFLSHALEQLPTLALDEMVIKRESIGSAVLEAQLRFTLFVRGNP